MGAGWEILGEGPSPAQLWVSPSVPHERQRGYVHRGCVGRSEGLALPTGGFGPGALLSRQLWLKTVRER